MEFGIISFGSISFIADRSPSSNQFESFECGKVERKIRISDNLRAFQWRWKDRRQKKKKTTPTSDIDKSRNNIITFKFNKLLFIIYHYRRHIPLCFEKCVVSWMISCHTVSLSLCLHKMQFEIITNKYETLNTFYLFQMEVKEKKIGKNNSVGHSLFAKFIKCVRSIPQYKC